MGKLVVLFGPPATGKSWSFKTNKKILEKKGNHQIVSIDKDIINKYFFYPSLVKTTKQSPFEIIWKTTSHLIELISSAEYKELLEQDQSPDKRELVVFLQGVTFGGVASDIETLLNTGHFTLEFVLLAVEDPIILYKRITARAEKEAVGAPPMALEELQSYVNTCNSTFYKVVKSLNTTEKQVEYTNEEERTFFSTLEKYRDSISCRVELTRKKTNDVDLTSYSDTELEFQLKQEVYLSDEISIQSESILLENRSNPQYILATG